MIEAEKEKPSTSSRVEGNQTHCAEERRIRILRDPTKEGFEHRTQLLVELLRQHVLPEDPCPKLDGAKIEEWARSNPEEAKAYIWRIKIAVEMICSFLR